MQYRKRGVSARAFVLGLTVCILSLATAISPAWAQTPAAEVKNVIVMVPDGCSQSIQTLTRWYKGEALTLDSMVTGMVSTHMADSVITGSAAAATAFATGYKTSARFIGVGPKPENVLSTMDVPPREMWYKPLGSVLEGAKLMKGKATGLISTSRITHATPASYAAHIHDRGLDNDIMEHLVYQDVDVVFGGGSRHLLPADQGGRRTDGEDLKAELLARGYQWADTKAEMDAINNGKAWGLFASSHMEAELDRTEFAPDQPSLSEMTQKAIELLSDDPDGFFLMVEGSQVDWAGHANDPVYMVTDFLEFDAAVQVAKSYAEQQGNTLLMVFSDHNTGGLAIGNTATEGNYTATSVEKMVDPLKGMTLTATGLGRKIGSDLSVGNIKTQVKTWWNIDLTDEQANEIITLVGGGMYLSNALGEVISKYHTVFGWTTHGHTAEDVPLWAYGPNRPVGFFDNTQLATVAANAFGFNLAEITDRLFIDVDTAFADWEIVRGTQTQETDINGNPVYDINSNPIVRIQNAYLAFSKDLMLINDQVEELSGFVVYAPKTGKVYIPEDAVRKIRFNGLSFPTQ